MKKHVRLRLTVIASAFAVYSVYMHIQQFINGCVWVRGHQRCSFENSVLLGRRGGGGLDLRHAGREEAGLKAGASFT